MIKVLRFIANHPLNRGKKVSAILNFFRWQISQKLFPFPIVYPFTKHSKLIVKKGAASTTGNLYCGLLEYEDMAFLLHSLSDTDVFIDIGANAGVYTVLASAEIGARTIAIEPIPMTFEYLTEHINLNHIQPLVTAINCGLGSSLGNLNFTKHSDTTNRVATNKDKDTISVPIKTLDQICSEHNYPTLIKIDVEGFETEVIKGGEKTLNHPKLNAIIIELNGSGKTYGYDEKEIHNTLLSYKFKPYRYTPKNKTLSPLPSYGAHNTIYIKDLEFIKKKLASSASICVRGHQNI